MKTSQTNLIKGKLIYIIKELSNDTIIKDYINIIGKNTESIKDSQKSLISISNSATNTLAFSHDNLTAKLSPNPSLTSLNTKASLKSDKYNKTKKQMVKDLVNFQKTKSFSNLSTETGNSQTFDKFNNINKKEYTSTKVSSQCDTLDMDSLIKGLRKDNKV